MADLGLELSDEMIDLPRDDDSSISTPGDPLSDPMILDKPNDAPPKPIEKDEKMLPLNLLVQHGQSEFKPNRIWVSHNIPSLLRQIPFSAAIEYALPIIHQLAADEDRNIKESILSNLAPTLQYYYKTCAEIEQNLPQDSSINEDHIQVVKTTLQSIISILLFDPVIEFSHCARDALMVLPYIMNFNLYKKEIIEDFLYSHTQRFLDSNGNENESTVYRRVAILKTLSQLIAERGLQFTIDIFFEFIQRSSSHAAFQIRKECALLLGSLSYKIEIKTFLDHFFRYFVILSEDPFWQVRNACCHSFKAISISLFSAINSQQWTLFFDRFISDDHNQVRKTAYEILGELIVLFKDIQPIREHLLHHFLAVSPVGESQDFGSQEILFSCAFNFPAILTTIGKERWDDVKECYIALTKVDFFDARRSLSCSLHEVAKIVGPEISRTDLIPVLFLYLMDVHEIKLSVLEHVSLFLECLNVDGRIACLPILLQVFKQGSTEWRIREVLAKQLSLICPLIPSNTAILQFLPLSVSWANDPVSVVRDVVAHCFPPLFLKAKEDSNLTIQFFESVINFSKSNHFRGRLFFIQICDSLLYHQIDQVDFEQFFLPSLASLASDRVVNVRIAIARIIKRIVYSYQEYTPTQTDILSSVISKLLEDSDRDVLSIVESSLKCNNIEKLHIHYNSHTSQPPSADRMEIDSNTPITAIPHFSSGTYSVEEHERHQTMLKSPVLSPVLSFSQITFTPSEKCVAYSDSYQVSPRSQTLHRRRSASLGDESKPNRNNTKNPSSTGILHTI